MIKAVRENDFSQLIRQTNDPAHSERIIDGFRKKVASVFSKT